MAAKRIPVKILKREKKGKAVILTINSSRGMKTKYHLKLIGGKIRSCSCQGWTLRFPRKPCRHFGDVAPLI